MKENWKVILENIETEVHLCNNVLLEMFYNKIFEPLKSISEERE